MHSSQERSVQRSDKKGGASAAVERASGHAVQLKGLDLVQQEAALDPNQQPGFAEQDAGMQAHGGQEGCATTSKTAVKAVTIDSAEVEMGTIYLKGTLTTGEGEEIAIDTSMETSKDSAKALAFTIAAEHNLDKAGQEKVRAAIAAKLPK